MGIRSEEAVALVQNEAAAYPVRRYDDLDVYLFIMAMIFTLPWDQGFVSILFVFLLFVAMNLTTTFELFIQKMQKERTQLDSHHSAGALSGCRCVHCRIYNEPVDLLYKTVNACTFMDYPDKRKVHSFVRLWGTARGRVVLLRQFGVGYLGFPGNTEAKSGNLNHALNKTAG